MTSGAASKEAGAALIVVLLLVATLSFVALSIAERAAFAASRSTNARARDALFWQGAGVEALARQAIAAAMEATPGKLTSQSPLVALPIEAPLDGGSARLSVVDRTRCFNLNSLVATEDDPKALEKSADELAALLRLAGAGAVSSRGLAGVVADWIDKDGFQRPDGAEDGYYTALPAPYRSGATLLADISELRAMADIDRLAYGAAKPFLCAQPTSRPSVVNLNMLTEAHAPLLAAMIGEGASLSLVEDAIRSRPPGGYETVESFWSNRAFADMTVPDETKARTGVYSRYLEVKADLQYYEARMQLSLLYEVGANGRARLLSRRLGEVE